MKQIGNMKLYSFEDVKDEFISKVCTSERNGHEQKVEEALHDNQIREATKNALFLKKKRTKTVCFKSLYLIILALTACNSDFLTIDIDNIDAPSDGVTAEIHINVNKNWTAKSSADWCTISPSSGNEDTKVIHVTVSKSSFEDARECEVIISCGDKQEIVTVSQLQCDKILIGDILDGGDSSEMTFNMDISDAEIEFGIDVAANVEYDIFTDRNWLSFVRYESKTKGLSKSIAIFHADKNDSSEPRVGTITFRKKGDNMETKAVITQKQMDILYSSEKNISFNWNNAQLTIPVTSNVDFKTNIPESTPWLKVARSGVPGNYYLEISVEDFIPEPGLFNSNTVSDRTAIVTLQYGDLKEEIMITQAFKDYIWMSDSEITVYLGFNSSLSFIPYFHAGINSTMSINIDNPDVATIFDNGLILPLSKGTATITITNADNSYSSQCKLVVKKISDDTYARACIKNLTVYGSTSIVFHSNIYFPINPNTVEFLSVWLCYPDGTAYDIKGTSNGYTVFNPVIHEGGWNESVIRYYESWFVLYQIEIDGEYHEISCPVNPRVQTGNL